MMMIRMITKMNAVVVRCPSYYYCHRLLSTRASGWCAHASIRTDVLDALHERGWDIPTHVQARSAATILSKHSQNSDVMIAAPTGTGKTLAYLVPLINMIKTSEKQLLRDSSGDMVVRARKPRRPKALILVPTRDLAKQVLSVAKALAHTCRFSSRAVFGGSPRDVQAERLGAVVDLVVATPSRASLLLQRQKMFLGDVRWVVVDEADTMFDDRSGYGEELRQLLLPLMRRKHESTRKCITAAEQQHSSDVVVVLPAALDAPHSVQFILASASLAPRMRKIVESTLPGVRFVQPKSFHRPVPRLKQVFIAMRGRDKVDALVDVLVERIDTVGTESFKCMVFCNSIPSCRAVEHHLSERGFRSVGYHGGIPPKLRASSIQSFLNGQSQVMVCTDVAARGLDTTFVTDVVLFDFPLNPIDYLHRVGRTARFGRAGCATSLLKKGDMVLAHAIQRANEHGEPIEALSSNKLAYDTRRSSTQHHRSKTRHSSSKSRRRRSS